MSYFPLNLSFQEFLEIATPANPVTNQHRLYFKSDGNLYTLDSSGTETQVGSGGGGGANQSLSNLTSPTAINQTLFIPNTGNGPALQIGPVPGDGTLQASICTDTSYNNATVLLIQGLGSNSNNYSGIYIGNDAGEVALNVFVNGSGRNSDGGPNNATIRMENGASLRIKAVNGLTLEGAVSFPDNINDDSNTPSIDPNTRQLSDSGSNVSFDWENKILFDSSGGNSIDWFNRLISDNGGLTAIDYDARALLNASGVHVIDWAASTLKQGSNISVDWLNRILYASTSNGQVSWNLTTFSLANNQVVADTIETWSIADASVIQIEYSIFRGSSNIETGILLLTSNGTNSNLVQQASAIGASGITFSSLATGGIGGQVELQYTSTNTGTPATMKYIVKRWVA